MDEEIKRLKKYFIINTIVICIVVAFVTACISYDIFLRNSEKEFINAKNPEQGITSEESNKAISKTLELFRDKINDSFIGEIDEKKLVEETIKGYIKGLDDEYSEYMTAEEWNDYQAEALGNYVGVGIYMGVDKKTENIVVIMPIKGSPAEEAGIESGDIIVEVDGESVVGKDVSDVSKSVKGDEGTKVKIKVLREEQYLDFELERKAIKIYHVESKLLDNNIGYIQLITFDEGCSEEFKKAYEEVKSKGAQKIILDLRDNTGGLVSEALKIADFAIDKDNKILITVDAKNNKEIDYAQTDKMINEEIVVLTNEYSASASEILTGALKDNLGCKTVGSKTYGKGVIQSVFEFKDGSALKLTVQEYYTPNETKINKVGITPDYELEDNKETEEDEQLNKAIEVLKTN